MLQNSLILSVLLLLSPMYISSADTVQDVLKEGISGYSLCVSSFQVTQVDPDSSVLYGRKFIEIQNQDASWDIMCASSTAVTTSAGRAVSKNNGTWLIGLPANTPISSSRLSLYCISKDTSACSYVWITQGK